MKRYFIVILSVLFLLISAQKTYAADDAMGHWSEQNIRTLIDKGIMNGYGDGTFKPNNQITRAEFAKLIVESLGLQPTQSATSITSSSSIQFKDVKSGVWYYSVVNTAAEAGIVRGYPDNTFGPGKKISRQEMATMIIRALNTKSIYSGLSPLPFKDVNMINQVFKEDIQKVVYHRVMLGNPDNTFKPTSSATRGETAAVLIRMIKILNNEPIITYTKYDYTLSEMIQQQMAVSPQTDKYRNDKAYVSGEFINNIIVENGKTYGFIFNTTILNVREGNSTDYRIVGKLTSSAENPTKVEILEELENDKKEKWYVIKYGPWKNARSEDLAEYINPSKFSPTGKEYFQFLILSRPAGVTASELNSKILASKGILDGKGQSFVEASIQYNINEIYLVAHALLETGNGGSSLANGIEVNSIVQRDSKGNPILNEKGEPITTPVEKKTVYNIFGIGALDANPELYGADMAYQQGWFSPEAAIVGGAKFISDMYVNNTKYKQDTQYKQDTLYKMRWNPDKPGTHQYATDIGWAVKQVNQIEQMYRLLDSYTLYYDVPVYK